MFKNLKDALWALSIPFIHTVCLFFGIYIGRFSPYLSGVSRESLMISILLGIIFSAVLCFASAFLLLFVDGFASSKINSNANDKRDSSSD